MKQQGQLPKLFLKGLFRKMQSPFRCLQKGIHQTNHSVLSPLFVLFAEKRSTSMESDFEKEQSSQTTNQPIIPQYCLFGLRITSLAIITPLLKIPLFFINNCSSTTQAANEYLNRNSGQYLFKKSPDLSKSFQSDNHLLITSACFSVSEI